MEIPLFQLSQVSRHPEWKPNIDAWFKLGVSKTGSVRFLSKKLTKIKI
jgi:hypothetical protein